VGGGGEDNTHLNSRPKPKKWEKRKTRKEGEKGHGEKKKRGDLLKTKKGRS